MEELFNQISTNSTDIVKKLTDITDAISKPQILPIIINITIPCIFTFICVFISSNIEKRRSQKNYIWTCHIEYLKIIKQLSEEMSNLILEMEDLEKIPVFMFNEPNEKVNFKNKHDFFCVKDDAFELKKTMLSSVLKESEEPKLSEYQNKYIEKVNDLVDFDKFSKICYSYKIQAASYYCFISENLRNIGDEICSKILEARKNEMRNFDIYEYEKKLKDFEKMVEKEIFKMKKQ